ncbi:hypothetical protein PLESTB_000512900 [Pleodorina starrii]|uniref:Sugar phosphate transporter domain-containing protein n=1 Tax=Pleodorina starrii TaxID=330485 RepID=A0A9W6BGU7_9CHLO|nr:hypothetical protein PLESTM_000375900 [Pleodorina starrii]GLC51535.1 hypothetical protein PLESTB_000512900 [Pleodorina starrii]GLC72300.1 hypothetical protein PLESTF_001232800 [Pleodorina starrii]
MEQRRQESEPLLPQSVVPDGNGPDKGRVQGSSPFKNATLAQRAYGFLGIGSAVLYGTVAVSMNFVNKASMQMLPLPNVVMVMQMVATFLILHPLREMGYLDFPKFSWQTCRRLFWITVLYTANVGFALFGLKTLNIPMYNVLKRLTPMIILIVKSIILKRWPKLHTSLAVFLVVAGCVVAGIGDLSFDMWGYAYALLSCTMQAAYLLIVEFQGDAGVGTTEMLYYNAITSVPFLLLVVAGTGEAAQLQKAYLAAIAVHGPASLWFTLISCSLMGCLLNYSMFLCTVNNSALTTTIVGVIKGVVAVFLGFFLLGGVKFSVVNVAGITLNTIGAVYYTYLKYQEKRAKRPIVASASIDAIAGSMGSITAMGGAGVLLSPTATAAPSSLGHLGSGPVPDEITGRETVVEVMTETPWAGGRQPASMRRHPQA